jgi:hypothetical protein
MARHHHGLQRPLEGVCGRAGPIADQLPKSHQRTVAANPDRDRRFSFHPHQVLLKTEPDDGEPTMDAPVLVGVDPASVGKVSVLPQSIVAGSFDLSDNGLLVGATLPAA